MLRSSSSDPATKAPARLPRLVASGLGYARSGEQIVGPLDLTLDSGEVLVIEGPNGSGKTTLLRVLAGLLEPTSGSLKFSHGSDNDGPDNDGSDNDGSENQGRPRPGAIAWLPHQLGLKAALSARENLAFGCALGGRRENTSPHAALVRVGLDGFEDLPVGQLSAGQKKRVALAQLLCVPADIWLLDEPYANLDPSGYQLVTESVRAHAERGGLVALTSHGHHATPPTGSARTLVLRG